MAGGKEGEKDGEGDVVANWNICDSLPKIFQDMFLATIAEYCLKIYQSNLSARRLGGRTITEGGERAEGEGEKAGGEMYEQLFHSISQRLLSVVEGFLSDSAPVLDELTSEQRIMTFYRKQQQQQKKQKQQQQQQHVVNWALEFSKMICKVLALDPLFEPKVQILKSQLLRFFFLFFLFSFSFFHFCSLFMVMRTFSPLSFKKKKK